MRTVYIRRALPSRRKASPGMRQKRGVLILDKVGKTLHVGWSLCNRTKDVYDNDLGKALALGRLYQTLKRGINPHVSIIPLSSVLSQENGSSYIDPLKLSRYGVPESVATWLHHLEKIGFREFDGVSRIAVVPGGKSKRSRKTQHD